jgi:hypothetical protein
MATALGGPIASHIDYNGTGLWNSSRNIADHTDGARVADIELQGHKLMVVDSQHCCAKVKPTLTFSCNKHVWTFEKRNSHLPTLSLQALFPRLFFCYGESMLLYFT